MTPTERAKYKAAKARVRLYRRKRRMETFHSIKLSCIAHPAVVFLKTIALIELLFVQKHLYSWCIYVEDYNMVHLFGIICFVILIANIKVYRKIGL